MCLCCVKTKPKWSPPPMGSFLGKDHCSSIFRWKWCGTQRPILPFCACQLLQRLQLFVQIVWCHVPGNCWPVLQPNKFRAVSLRHTFSCLQVKASSAHKGPYDFDLLVPVQDLKAEQNVSHSLHNKKNQFTQTWAFECKLGTLFLAFRTNEIFLLFHFRVQSGPWSFPIAADYWWVFFHARSSELKFILTNFPSFNEAAERDEVNTALWSHVRVVVVDPILHPPSGLTPPLGWSPPQADPPWPDITLSRDGWQGALGLYADEAYLLFQATGGQDNLLRVWVLKDSYAYFDDMRQKYSEGIAVKHLPKYTNTFLLEKKRSWIHMCCRGWPLTCSVFQPVKCPQRRHKTVWVHKHQKHPPSLRYVQKIEWNTSTLIGTIFDLQCLTTIGHIDDLSVQVVRVTGKVFLPACASPQFPARLAEKLFPSCLQLVRIVPSQTMVYN